MSKQPESFYAHRRIGFIPLDARPVCYDLPKQLAAMSGLELVCPTQRLLGHLKNPADETALFRWFKHHLTENIPIIVALDTVAYGGLISSRVGDESFKDIQTRLDRFFDTVYAEKIFGFSSILRIPAYNNAEEEPDYWAKYGKALYDYSYTAHEHPQALEAFDVNIPANILNDFLKRRARNFEVNQSHIQRLIAGQLQYLAFCQDDTGAYGINVQEAAALQQHIQKQQLKTAHVQTGADEVAACFLARLVSQWYKKARKSTLKVAVEYSDPNAANTLAKFDGVPIRQVVERAVATCGAEVLEDNSKKADLTLWVHTPPAETAQGDHCEEPWNQVDTPSLSNQAQIERILSGLKIAFEKQHPVALLDIAYANGSDPQLMHALFNRQDLPDLTKHLYGYAGWNTPGNAVGTGVAMAVLRLLAEKNGTYQADAFRQTLFTRFADDWLYQSEVRKVVRTQHPPDQPLPDEAETLLNHLLQPGLALLQERLHMQHSTPHAVFPCNRTFEVGITLEQSPVAI